MSLGVCGIACTSTNWNLLLLLLGVPDRTPRGNTACNWGLAAGDACAVVAAAAGRSALTSHFRRRLELGRLSRVVGSRVWPALASRHSDP